MTTCTASPQNKRAQARVVGDDLVRHYGKKPYYTVQEVKNANLRQKIDIDVACWSHALFNSHTDFDAYHRSIGESCDYGAMKGEMLASLSENVDSPWPDLDLSWLEFPEIDWSLFDFIDL